MEPVKKNGLSEEESQVIAALITHQGEQSDQVFASGNLSFSATVWGRIKNGQYWEMVQDHRPVLLKLQLDLDRYERQAATRARFENVKWVNFTEAKAVMLSIDDCLGKPLTDPVRMVVYLAPTGGGKTGLCGQVIRQHKARMVEAREAWVRSYFSCLRDLCLGLGVIDSRKYVSKDDMETELIRSLNARRQVVVIDEAEYFSPSSLNLLKLLLNKTTVVLFLAAIPDAYDRLLQKYPHETSQILRRTHAVYRLAAHGAIKPDTAARFLRHLKCESPDDCARRAARFANTFGLFDTIREIAAQFRDGQAVSPDDIARAGNNRLTKLGRPTLEFAT